MEGPLKSDLPCDCSLDCKFVDDIIIRHAAVVAILLTSMDRKEDTVLPDLGIASGLEGMFAPGGLCQVGVKY
jgi:hypothetical protein